jgi:tRNA-specific 2-thiouridylase
MVRGKSDERTVIAGVVGRVESSVARPLAVRAGCEVIGVTHRLKHPDPLFDAQLCASKNDDARWRRWSALGIEHHYIEL